MGCLVNKVHVERVMTPLSRGSMSTQDLALNPIYSQKERGRTFEDEYLLGQSIGTGAYSEVFVCVHRATGSSRAAKFYKTKLHALTKGSQESLVAEINIMLSLKHPNLLETIEFFQDSRTIVLISEYCEGGSLLDRLSCYSRFSEKQAAAVMKQLCFAVKNLHSHRIMLRSLTPDSVRFRTPDTDSKLKIVRFTNAIKYEQGMSLQEMVGPTMFMAPEMLDGEYDELCDEWNLGVLLYMMLSGYPPFEANRPEAIVERIKNRDYSLKKDVWPRISQEAKDLVNFFLAPRSKRMTADTALYHPWLHRHINASEPDTPAQDESLMSPSENISIPVPYYGRRRQSDSTPSSDLEKLKVAIARKDPVETGNINMDELMDIVVKGQFMLLSSDDMEEAIMEVGTDSAGYVCYQKVVRALEEKKRVFSRQNYGSEALLSQDNSHTKSEKYLNVIRVTNLADSRIKKMWSQPSIPEPTHS